MLATYVVLEHVLLDVLLPLDVGHVAQPPLQLRVLGLEDGDALGRDHLGLLALLLLVRSVQELLVGKLEGLPDGQSDLLSLEIKCFIFVMESIVIRNVRVWCTSKKVC